ncbi:hypothetical protein DPMN_143121 [Dreissena polymorpha]|uniref:Uncharacterized protein n=1 Tax=Dreissena polymorpha TaxID=45954 RepID=A0A9D4GFM9_DREPO|nr:hypothetical protein DPMN_143121 [Dreissena polymorpha]
MLIVVTVPWAKLIQTQQKVASESPQKARLNESEEPGPKQSRLPSLIAQAISHETKCWKLLLPSPSQPPLKPEGTTSPTTCSETESVAPENDDSTSMLSASNFGYGASTCSQCDFSLFVCVCVCVFPLNTHRIQR